MLAAVSMGILSCGRSDVGKERGTQGGPCYGNGTCDAGLNCSASDLCIIPSGTCVGANCGPSQHPDMVLFEDHPGGAYLIDIYEASVDSSGIWGDYDYDTDQDGKIADPEVVAAHASAFGFLFDDDGGEEEVVLTTKVALSRPGAFPVIQVSFYQAMAACTKAGKRLCTRAEWVWACRGGSAYNVYPYGSVFDGGDEVGHDCWTSGLSSRVQLTSAAEACVTPQGLYDMSGNAQEWTDFIEPGTALSSGGGWSDVAPADTTCEDTEPNPPQAHWGHWGFRCCLSQ